MNILLIGNGFDLAHGLPTRYTDFLDFCKIVKKNPSGITDIDSYLSDLPTYTDEKVYQAAKNRFWYLSFAIHEERYKSTYKELLELLDGNAWYKYFQALVHENKLKGKTWIDFEHEISIVVCDLEKLIKTDRYDGSCCDFLTVFKSVYPGLTGDFRSTDCIKKAENDLKRFTRALEIYLVFVEAFSTPKKLKQIAELEIDRALSFNYTSTYRIYQSNLGWPPYCYIHGYCDESHTTETCNLVLGIEDSIDGPQKEEDLTFIAYKKYYQRILKRTGNKYVSWINNINSSTSDMTQRPHKLYIFGHSLDKTDGDVLKKLITAKGMETNIFYYREREDDNADLAKKIQNLILIFGPEEVTRMSGEGIINFIPQDLPEKE